MTLKIFGKLTDIFQGNEYNFPLKESKTTAELKNQLAEQFPQLKEMTYLIIVNGEKAENDAIISENMEIALLPPFSGG